jgi:hypothetical protein
MALLGFSDGALNELFLKETDRYAEKYLQEYFFEAIEIHCLNEEVMDFIINELDVNLYSKFKYISLHAPVFYSENSRNIILLEKLRSVYKKFDLKNIVIHPDRISNWSILENFQDLPLSIENMDSDKDSFKTVSDFEKTFSKIDIDITLDLNHIYDNDQSMSLAQEFHEKFKDKIVEYHLSGYDRIKKHAPLMQTEQWEIINALNFKDIPIIIESSLDSIDSMFQEFRFVDDNLNQK